MATNDERMTILRLIEQGKISAEEGARLIAAMRSGATGASAETGGGAGTARNGSPKWLHVRVTDGATGRHKVDLALPFSLVDWAVRVSTRIAPSFVPDIDVDGVDISEVMEAIRSGQRGRIVDVYDDDDGERIEIVVE